MSAHKSTDEILQLAKAGHTNSQNELGIRYVTGLGVIKDFTKATTWFREASKDLAEAKFNMGLAYEAGLGVKKNIQLAIHWYKKAIDTDNYIPAYHNLGVIYQFVDGNHAEAVKYYKYAAGENFPLSQCNLGYLYLNGLGVNKDEKEAIRLFLASLEKNIPQAACHLGECFSLGIGVNQDNKSAFPFYQVAAKNGFPPAQKRLGELYRTGLGVKPDESLAFYWLMSAVNNGQKLSNEYTNFINSFKSSTS